MKIMDFLGDKISSQITMMGNFMNNMRWKYFGNEKSSSDEDKTYIQKLHQFLFLQNIDDTCYIYTRIGSKRDGGYIMVEPFSRRKIAYSIGICDNVDWDSGMVDKEYDVFMYDHTIDALPLKLKGFHWFKTGICGGVQTKDCKTLDVMLNENGHSQKDGMVLKMDVEGCEWDVLDSISKDVLLQFDQIILEIHFLLTSKDREKILRSLDKLSCTHDVVHIHANNTCRVEYMDSYVMPDVLEVTYLKKGYCKLKPMMDMLPRAIDKASTIRLPEIRLGKWNG